MSTPKLVIVGEAWGEHEAQLSLREGRPTPFVGKSGFFLYSHLCQAEIIKEIPPLHWPGAFSTNHLWQKAPHIHLTNVFQQRPSPSSDDVLLFFCPRTEAIPGIPPLTPSLGVRPEYSHHLLRLQKELEELRPNLILALGNTALWALTGHQGIRDARGTIHQTPFGKVLPTYHPAAILRKYSLLPIFLADLYKARIEMESPLFERVEREIWTEPSISDLHLWWELHGRHSSLLSLDIETLRNSQIGEFGVASSPTQALHIPFILEDKAARKFLSYWTDPEEELQAWQFVRQICESPIPKIGQNFLYDLQYLLWKMRIPVRNVSHDTMLEHHALFPGMEKSLGFLSSIYCNEPQYKYLRRHSNKDEE